MANITKEYIESLEKQEKHLREEYRLLTVLEVELSKRKTAVDKELNEIQDELVLAHSWERKD